MVRRVQEHGGFAAGLCAFVFCLLASSPGWAKTATFYRGTGSHGEAFFTDNPAAIPGGKVTQIQIRFPTPQPAADRSPAMPPAPPPIPAARVVAETREAPPPIAAPPPAVPQPQTRFLFPPSFRRQEGPLPKRFLVPRPDRLDPNYVWIGRYRYAKSLFHFPNVSLEQEHELRERFGPLLGFPSGTPSRSSISRARPARPRPR